MTKSLVWAALAYRAAAACISSGNETTINSAFKAGGTGTVIQLCPNAVITVHNTIAFTAPNQELSTQGYPTDASRGIIRLQATDQSISAVVRGGSINGIRLRNIRIDGDRTSNGQVVDQGMDKSVVSHSQHETPSTANVLIQPVRPISKLVEFKPA
jgi:hypothetical protein